jgi:hypothetical protein
MPKISPEQIKQACNELAEVPDRYDAMGMHRWGKIKTSELTDYTLTDFERTIII